MRNHLLMIYRFSINCFCGGFGRIPRLRYFVIFGLKIIGRYSLFFSLHHSLMIFLHCRFCFSTLYIFQFFIQFQCMRRILHRICTLVVTSIEFTVLGICNGAFFDILWFFIAQLLLLLATENEVMSFDRIVEGFYCRNVDIWCFEST
ncbi:unnamed protein product [Vicia faba]|uniref:Uncharacterized protein n=1 Tax=Vicia faba TaxID=3906 RepID=A0AAV1AYE4_VICFA|nr:unnamed protein product [Vicia faba]